MAKRQTKPAVKWLDLTLVRSGVRYSFTSKEAKYLAECARLGVPHQRPFVNPGATATTHIFTQEDGGTVCIVTLDRAKVKGYPKSHIYAILCHEAVHVWQEVRQDLGEQAPSSEFEAYSIQAIMRNMAEAYDDGE